MTAPFLSDTSTITNLTNDKLALIVGAFIGFLVFYLACKIFVPRDFGMPVRRKVVARGIRIERDQVAYVPLWWSDLQVTRAVKTHFRRSLQESFQPSPGRR